MNEWQRLLVFKCELRGCLHDTGATFAPGRVHSGSLSWLYICLHDTTTKCYAGASQPGVSSPRLTIALLNTALSMIVGGQEAGNEKQNLNN